MFVFYFMLCLYWERFFLKWCSWYWNISKVNKDRYVERYILMCIGNILDFFRIVKLDFIIIMVIFNWMRED